MNKIKRLIIVSLGLSAVMFGMHAAQQEQIPQLPLQVEPEQLQPIQWLLLYIVLFELEVSQQIELFMGEIFESPVQEQKQEQAIQELLRR